MPFLTEHCLFYDIVSVIRCVIPYTYRKQLEMLFKLMELRVCKIKESYLINNGEQARVQQIVDALAGDPGDLCHVPWLRALSYHAC